MRAQVGSSGTAEAVEAVEPPRSKAQPFIPSIASPSICVGLVGPVGLVGVPSFPPSQRRVVGQFAPGAPGAGWPVRGLPERPIRDRMLDRSRMGR